ncbi:hypothetical protein ACLOJK_037641 [Asimina triloba]
MADDIDPSRLADLGYDDQHVNPLLLDPNAKPICPISMADPRQQPQISNRKASSNSSRHPDHHGNKMKLEHNDRQQDLYMADKHGQQTDGGCKIESWPTMTLDEKTECIGDPGKISSRRSTMEKLVG